MLNKVYISEIRYSHVDDYEDKFLTPCSLAKVLTFQRNLVLHDHCVRSDITLVPASTAHMKLQVFLKRRYSCDKQQVIYLRIEKYSVYMWSFLTNSKLTKLRGLSPRANYTDKAAAAGRRN